MRTVIENICVYFDDQDPDTAGYVASMQCLLNAEDKEDVEDWQPYFQTESIFLDSQTEDDAITDTADILSDMLSSTSKWVLNADKITFQKPHNTQMPSLRHVTIKDTLLPVVVVDETNTVLRRD